MVCCRSDVCMKKKKKKASDKTEKMKKYYNSKIDFCRCTRPHVLQGEESEGRTS